MDLKTFSDKAPAPTISAKDLDDNFRRLRPRQTDGAPRHYYLDEGPDGWSIRVLPPFPSGVGPFLLGYNRGVLYWTGSGVDDGNTGNPEEDTNPVLAPNPPATGTYVLGSVEGVVQWIETEACT
jgi:hypothetical protein